MRGHTKDDRTILNHLSGEEERHTREEFTKGSLVKKWK